MSLSVRSWRTVVGIFVSAGVLFCAVALGAAFKVYAELKRDIPFDMKVENRFLDGWGGIHLNGLSFQKPGSEHAIVEGDFLIRYNPLEVFFRNTHLIRIDSKRIVSDLLQAWINQNSQTAHIHSLNAEIIMNVRKDLTIRHAELDGTLVKATLSGTVGSDGKLDLESKWILGKDVLEQIPEFLTTPLFSGEPVPSGLPSSTEIRCLLLGDIHHPRIILDSDLVKIELG